MNAALILDRVKQLELLKNDKAELWQEITTQFPYCTIAQWLKFGADKFSHQENLKNIFLYKSDPIEFASYLRQLGVMVDGHSDQAQELIIKSKPSDSVLPDDKSSKIPETDLPVEKELTAKQNELESTLPVLENPQIVDDMVALPEPTVLPVNESKENYAEILEEIREDKSVPEETGIDILELINEIPNSTPFDLAEKQRNSIQTENVEVNIEHQQHNSTTELNEPDQSESEEDKSLMVMMSFTDWLNHFKQKSDTEREEVREKKALKTAWQKEKLAEAADEELDEIPEPIFKQAMDSISMESSLISESLAEILAMQGKKDKAVAMYKKLIVRNPEKSNYFNNKIQELNATDN